MFFLRRNVKGIIASLIFFPVSGFSAALSALESADVPEPVLSAPVCAKLTSSLADDTRRLQSAIDNCPRGEVLQLQSGRFSSGPLSMKSGVTLWISQGAMLVANSDPRVYDKNGHCGTVNHQGNGCRPFILFSHTDGGGIVGEGIIDGQGGKPIQGQKESWWKLARRAQTEGGAQNVPRLIEADDASHLIFHGITLRNSPGFHVTLKNVRDATFWGVRIDTPANARNTDGIDPISSQNILIAHSFIRTGDDNVAIKAGAGGVTRHVILVDNHFYWGHGMSIGSETLGGVSDIRVRDLTLDGTTSGLRIKSDISRGGVVSDVRYENVCMRGNRRPLDFDTRYDAHAIGNSIPVYRNITLSHISGESGQLVLRGYDAAHPLQFALNGVSFSNTARWLTESAQIRIGPDGVSPVPPGKASLPRSAVPADCTKNWISFPVTDAPED
ncbi:glycosyl hydrolase family 28 protein [Kosakonia sp. R1.Fl]|uniref:glycoside hydrolase family 28 protein n=1 Tax=Kosakonia sp. R1.Fl TaxID=2928706 RepID=UPI00201D7011|nr:glycosyl hydrolase family 28 protein [Kosakonia sp. R1.Fl]MCL6746239.1 glycosyl hydrolase family 28 protein [Kosakonia sp. R1.Fl]